jgi:uncharacterized protein involved in type VI secretion and phage assembly
MATLLGVYAGSVLDNRDPENLARVLVRVPALTEAGAADVWARVATLMAGRNRGTFFVPDAGDEVIVAFERGDARSPIVIGALWNGKARPPATAAEAAGGLKLIRSRNGVALKIRDDSSNNSLVLETPGGQRITLQDAPGSVRVEDANGNSVTLAASGVTVNASSVLRINASVLEISASTVTVNSGMSRFTGTVQCNTLISDSVISASYSPGAGNIW